MELYFRRRLHVARAELSSADVFIVPRILIIEDERARTMVRTSLFDYEIEIVTNWEEAEPAILDPRFGLFIVGVNFDTANAMKLINKIRANRHHHKKPILLLRLLPNEVSAFVRQTALLLKKVGLINDFFESDDLNQERDRFITLVTQFLPARRHQTG